MAVKRRANPASLMEVHPLNSIKWLEVEIWYERESDLYVTRIPRLELSSQGTDEEEALDNTAEMLMAWLRAMRDHRRKLPLNRTELAEVNRVLSGWQ